MPIDRAIEAQTRRLKRRQHAAASWEQLRQVGWTGSQILTRVKRGEWQRPFPRAYILGDPGLVPLAMESAALLSYGEQAVLSHRTAAALWALTDAKPPVIELTVARAAIRQRPSVRAHLIHSLDAKDVRYQHALRVTSPARTVIDLAIAAASSELERACGDAVAQRLMTEHDLTGALARVPDNHSGAARIRRRLQEDPQLLLHTRSVAERIAYPLILEAGLPRPALNEWVHGELVDLHWPQHKVIVEVDSFQWHGSRQAFENDRRRDQVLSALGYIVIRVTWRQLTREPYRVIATIAQALALAGPGLRAA